METLTKKNFRKIIDNASIDLILKYGCRLWNNDKNEKGQKLYLFPYEFYNIIPTHYIVYSISGKAHLFKKGKSDDDTRFGLLAYGIYK